jgi:hypothetical protein
MTLVKKVDPYWFPNNDRTVKVGDIIDVTYPDELIEEGKVALTTDLSPVEEYRSIDTKNKCTTCGFVSASSFGLQAHQRKHDKDISSNPVNKKR